MMVAEPERQKRSQITEKRGEKLRASQTHHHIALGSLDPHHATRSTPRLTLQPDCPRYTRPSDASHVFMSPPARLACMARSCMTHPCTPGSACLRACLCAFRSLTVDEAHSDTSRHAPDCGWICARIGACMNHVCMRACRYNRNRGIAAPFLQGNEGSWVIYSGFWLPMNVSAPTFPPFRPPTLASISTRFSRIMSSSPPCLLYGLSAWCTSFLGHADGGL